MCSPASLNNLLDPCQSILPNSLRLTNIGDKLHKGASVLDAPDFNKFYLALLTQWNPDEVVLNSEEHPTYLNGSPPSLTGFDNVQMMMALDSITYLPDDILTKVDRASMSVSIENRAFFRS